MRGALEGEWTSSFRALHVGDAPSPPTGAEVEEWNTHFGEGATSAPAAVVSLGSAALLSGGRD